jgi:hypothetical protein
MNARPMPLPLLPMSLRAVVGGIGLIVALLCSLIVPGVYATFEYVERADILSFKAHLNASRLAKYIYAHETLWQYHRVRLAELIELPQDEIGALRQRVFDNSGKLVLEEGPEVSWPALRRSAPIFVKGVMVGRLEAEASLASSRRRTPDSMRPSTTCLRASPCSMPGTDWPYATSATCRCTA